MLLRTSATPCEDVRFVFPRGFPSTTTDALCVTIQSPQAFIPALIRSCRVFSSSLFQFDRDDSEPSYMARKFFIDVSNAAKKPIKIDPFPRLPACCGEGRGRTRAHLQGRCRSVETDMRWRKKPCLNHECAANCTPRNHAPSVA